VGRVFLVTFRPGTARWIKPVSKSTRSQVRSSRAHGLEFESPGLCRDLAKKALLTMLNAGSRNAVVKAVGEYPVLRCDDEWRQVILTRPVLP